MVQRKTKSKKKITRVIKKGKMYVSATFNNTLVSITDEKGAVVSWASTGAEGFSG